MDRTAADALRSFEKLLAERPEKVGDDFSDATRRVAAWRDELTEDWRRTQAEIDRRRMAAINAVLSVLLGCQYPSGEIHWPALEDAQSLLWEITT